MMIFCCGMIRAGSTLQYQIVTEIVEKKKLGRTVGWFPPNELSTVIKVAQNDDNLVIIKTHEITDQMLNFNSSQAKFVFIHRDIRDVLVSSMKKFEWTFEVAFLNSQHAVEEYMKAIQLNGVYISQYDKVIDDLVLEVKNISKYLKIKLTNDEIKSIADDLSLTKQKQRTSDMLDHKESLLKSPGLDSVYYDPKTQLHTNHIFNGSTGYYKNNLSKAEIDIVEYEFLGWLYEAGYINEKKSIILSLKKGKKQIEKLSIELKNANEQLSDSEKSRVELITQIKEYESLNGLHETLKGENESLKGEYESLNGLHETLKGENESLKGEYESLNGLHETLKGENESLKGEYESLNGLHETLKGENESLKGEYESLNGLHEALKGENESLKKDLDIIKQKFESVSDKYEQIFDEKYKAIYEDFKFYKNRYKTHIKGFEKRIEILKYNYEEKVIF